MADVEIISMLMPSSASVSNIVAATPGFVFMPGADEADTWAMSASVVTPGGADLGGERPRTIRCGVSAVGLGAR